MSTESYENDTRTSEQVRYDATVDQVIALTATVQRMADIIEKAPGHHQTVTYRVEGMGIVGIICAAICAMPLPNCRR